MESEISSLSGSSRSISSWTTGVEEREPGGSVDVGARDEAEGAEATEEAAAADGAGVAGRTAGAVVVTAAPSAPPYFVASARKTSVVAPFSVSSTPMPFMATAS